MSRHENAMASPDLAGAIYESEIKQVHARARDAAVEGGEKVERARGENLMAGQADDENLGRSHAASEHSTSGQGSQLPGDIRSTPLMCPERRLINEVLDNGIGAGGTAPQVAARGAVLHDHAISGFHAPYVLDVRHLRRLQERSPQALGLKAVMLPNG